MNGTKLTQFLLASGFFNETIANNISAQFTVKSIEKSDYIITMGRISTDYYFLEEGLIRSFAIDVKGDEITTNFYFEGQLVFEPASFFTKTPSKEYFQALTDCTVWYLSFAQLNELFHNVPEFREFGRSRLAGGLAQLKTRMLSMITETAEQRYAQLLQTKPQILQQVPLKYIATYLGITDTSLSRVRKEYAVK